MHLIYSLSYYNVACENSNCDQICNPPVFGGEATCDCFPGFVLDGDGETCNGTFYYFQFKPVLHGESKNTQHPFFFFCDKKSLQKQSFFFKLTLTFQNLKFLE